MWEKIKGWPPPDHLWWFGGTLFSDNPILDLLGPQTSWRSQLEDLQSSIFARVMWSQGLPSYGSNLGSKSTKHQPSVLTSSSHLTLQAPQLRATWSKGWLNRWPKLSSSRLGGHFTPSKLWLKSSPKFSRRRFRRLRSHPTWHRAHGSLQKCHAELPSFADLGVSINGGPPKSSIYRWIAPYKPSIGGTPIYGNHHLGRNHPSHFFSSAFLFGSTMESASTLQFSDSAVTRTMKFRLIISSIPMVDGSILWESR